MCDCDDDLLRQGVPELEPDPAVPPGAACVECERPYGLSHLGMCSAGSLMLGADSGIVGFRRVPA